MVCLSSNNREDVLLEDLVLDAENVVHFKCFSNGFCDESFSHFFSLLEV